MKNGVTLLETIVVIALIAILSIFGVNTINNFKRDASLDNTANELVSEIRVARSKSMNGEVLSGEKEEDFDPSVTNSLPEYGINIKAHGYELVRRCVKVSGNCNSEPAIETVFIDDDFSLVPEGSFYFERITGNFSGITIKIMDNAIVRRNINITKDFSVTVENNVLGVNTSALQDWFNQIPVQIWMFFVLFLILPIMLCSVLILIIQNWPH